MDILKLSFKHKSYEIKISNNFDNLSTSLEEIYPKDKKIMIISDKNVAKIYKDSVLNELSKFSKNIFFYEINPGEENKNIDSLSDIFEEMSKNKMDRKSLLLAVGGGVVGDITGFAAASYMRGIDYIQVPTSLLAQVDSSIGGKTAIDFLSIKNLIGAFYQSSLVYINLSTLKTLDKREINCGLAELIKHAIIKDNELLNYIIENKEKIAKKDMECYKYLINKSCAIKSLIVMEDEKEEGIRAVLNFGHTIGHAIESVYDFKYNHGESVVFGMISALFLSKKQNNLSDDYINKILDLFLFFGFDTKIKDIDIENIYHQIFLDKKVDDGKIRFVLLEKEAKAYINNKLSENDIKEAIKILGD